MVVVTDTCPKCQGFLHTEPGHYQDPYMTIDTYCVNCGWRRTREPSQEDLEDFVAGRGWHRRKQTGVILRQLFRARRNPTRCQYSDCEDVIGYLIDIGIPDEKLRVRVRVCLTHLRFWERRGNVTIRGVL